MVAIAVSLQGLDDMGLARAEGLEQEGQQPLHTSTFARSNVVSNAV